MRLRIPVSLSGRALSGTGAAVCRQSPGACARVGVTNSATMVQAANPMTPTDSLRLCMVRPPCAPNADPHSLTRRTRQFQRLVENLVAAFGDALDGAAHRMGGTDADAVVPRAVVLEHAQAGPPERVASRHHEWIDIAIGARGCPANDIAQPVRLDDSHHRLGPADGPAVGHEDDASLQSRLLRPHVPPSPAAPFPPTP